MSEMLNYKEIVYNAEIQVYFKYMEEYFENANGDFNFIKRKGRDKNHAIYASKIAERILKYLGYKKKEQELAKIAAYVHDIGNIVSRYGHDQSSAIMFLNIVKNEDKYNEDVFSVMSAIGCHEDRTIEPISPIAAALMIGDKTDINHERIGVEDLYNFDKYSLVVAACKRIDVIVNKDRMSIELKINIDDKICSVMNYFEIFMSRIDYCRKASKVLKCSFELYINNDKFL